MEEGPKLYFEGHWVGVEEIAALEKALMEETYNGDVEHANNTALRARVQELEGQEETMIRQTKVLEEMNDIHDLLTAVADAARKFFAIVEPHLDNTDELLALGAALIALEEGRGEGA